MGWIILKHADDANDCGWKNSRALIDSGWQRSWKWRKCIRRIARKGGIREGWIRLYSYS